MSAPSSVDTTCAWTASNSSQSEPPGTVLIVGECGDGKSSLLNKIRDPNRSGQAASGLRSRGVTKEIKAYVGMPIAGREIDYFDTPGDGDMDVTPMDLLALIEQELIGIEVSRPNLQRRLRVAVLELLK